MNEKNFEKAVPLCPIRERIGPSPRECKCSLVRSQGGLCAYGSAFEPSVEKAEALPESVAPPVNPAEQRKATCPVERFGRPHHWMTGAFLWPHGEIQRQWYIGEDYVMCGSCGQIEENA